ncbi:hypothetical protein JL721_5669 [Aureococcus anophagefferens]|nr:hypothetical protein JL721_5669 [Aureococcus anophagefferens]
MAPRPSIAYISSFRETSFTASLDAPQEADENTRSPNPFRNVASSLLQMKNFRYSPAPAADGGDAQMKKEARAAWFVEDAMIGVFDPVGMLKKRLEHRELYVRYENMVHPERLICVLLLTVVSFVEIPLWCLERRSDVFAWEDARALCAAPGRVYLSGTDYLPVGATLLAEFACVGYLATLVGMEAAFGFRDGARFRARAAATAAYAADCVLFLVAEVGFGSHPAFRFAPYLRVALLAVNVTAIYESLEAVVALLPAFFNVSALLALCVGISGWLAAITFDDLDFENREGVDVNDGFDSLGTSIYTMFFVSTTANFPDQMLPSFTYRRTFGLFFFIYVLLAVFIFLNLILAVVYNEYSDFVKGRVIEANRNRARGLNEAFKLLADAKGDDGSPQISRDAFEKLVEHTNDVERVPRVEAGEVAFFFSIMDDDKSGAISKAEFYDVCDILQYSFVKEAFAVVEMLFSIAYAALLAAQLAVEPFDEFWLHTSNRFDATVTVVLFGAAVFWALPFVDVSRDVLHRLTILRLGRLLTVLNQVDRFRLICECVAKIVPASTGVVGVLFCAGALWSGAGVQLFGGLVYDGNGALEGSDYLDSHYDVLNFNDFAMGFLPLFAMVTSGGPYTEFVEALNDVSGAKGAGYYFFVSFYVVGVLIFFNVFSAFVIDAFLSQYTEARALAHDDEADTLDQSCVEEGYRIVATRRSAQNDVYRAMFLEDDDGDDDDDDEGGVIN